MDLNNTMVKLVLKRLSIVLDEHNYREPDEAFKQVYERMIVDPFFSINDSSYLSPQHIKVFFVKKIIPALEENNYGYEDLEKFLELYNEVLAENKVLAEQNEATAKTASIPVEKSKEGTTTANILEDKLESSIESTNTVDGEVEAIFSENPEPAITRSETTLEEIPSSPSSVYNSVPKKAPIIISMLEYFTNYADFEVHPDLWRMARDE